MKVIKVVCGIIWKDEKIFIARRKPEKYLGGFWEFPGGKQEMHETAEESLVRELNEELGMKVIVVKHFKTVFHKYEKFTIELIAFLCQFKEATFIMTDHDKYFWISIDELESWKLTPADVPIAKEIKLLYAT